MFYLDRKKTELVWSTYQRICIAVGMFQRLVGNSSSYISFHHSSFSLHSTELTNGASSLIIKVTGTRYGTLSTTAALLAFGVFLNFPSFVASQRVLSTAIVSEYVASAGEPVVSNVNQALSAPSDTVSGRREKKVSQGTSDTSNCCEKTDHGNAGSLVPSHTRTQSG